jgi:hypothetical protein
MRAVAVQQRRLERTVTGVARIAAMVVADTVKVE